MLTFVTTCRTSSSRSAIGTNGLFLSEEWRPLGSQPRVGRMSPTSASYSKKKCWCSPDGHTFLKRECELFDGPFGCVAGTLFDQSRPARPSDRLYARAPLEGGLRAEVSLEGLEALVGGAAGAHRFKAEKCGVWLGSAGCVTPLHFDLWHGFLAGILGTKLFTYLAPEDFRSLYPRPEQPEISKISISLQLDLDAAARLATQLTAGEAGPEAEMLAWHALVRPGDVLYTPPYWWHHVETGADEPALSVLVPFDPTADEALHSCFR